MGIKYTWFIVKSNNKHIMLRLHSSADKHGGIPKFVVSHTSFDNKGREVCRKVSLYKNSQRHSCSAINCLSSGINILAGGRSLPPEILAQTDPLLMKAASFDTFYLVTPQGYELAKKVQLWRIESRILAFQWAINQICRLSYKFRQ